MKSIRERALSIFLTCIMFLLILPAAAIAAEPDEPSDDSGSAVMLDIANGSITITGTGYKQGTATEETAYTGAYILTGSYSDSFTAAATADTNQVKISAGSGSDVQVTLKDLTIKHHNAENSFKYADGNYSPIQVLSGTVNLSLEGSSTLIGDGKNSGLYIAKDATAVIKGSGLLTCCGGHLGAGIGACNFDAAGSLIVESGNITAKGGVDAAGIGGSWSQDLTMQSVTINGGYVDAYAGVRSISIGNGRGSWLYNLSITGGTIICSGSNTCRVAGQTVSITGGNIGDFYNGTVSGRTKTTLYFFNDDNSVKANTEVTVKEGDHTWTAKTYANGEIITYLLNDTTNILAAVGGAELSDENIFAAKIGNAYYPTLAGAVAAAQDGETVELLCNASGNGVSVMENEAKDITIDLGGYTYTVSGGAVGSTNYETQGFHLEKGSKITIKNGTITSTADSGVKMLVQNYCDLTLEDVTLDGTNLVNAGTGRYVFSNNCGNTVLTGNTNIIAKDGDFAFDCYYWPSNGYTEGVTVTLGTDFTGKITGNIEMSDDGTDTANAASKQSISISGGTFTTDVSAFLADGYKLTTNEDGIFGVVLGEEETEPEILKKSLCVKYSQLGNYNGKNTIKLSLFAGVDTLNYSEVGFDVTLNGVTKTFPVKVVYDSVTVKMGDEIKTIPASDFGKGVNHIFGYTINFPATEEFKNATGTWTPYAIRNKEKITGNTFILNNIFSGELEVSE